MTQASPSPSTPSSKLVDTPCLFCDEGGNKKEMRKAATLHLDKKVNDCAQLLGDKHLLSQLSSSGIITINAVCHCACLNQLYSKLEMVKCDMTESHVTPVIWAHVLNELLNFIEDNRGSGMLLAMGDSMALYNKCLAARRSCFSLHQMQCNTSLRGYWAYNSWQQASTHELLLVSSFWRWPKQMT